MKILKCFMLIVLTLALLCSHVSCSNTPVEEKNSDVSENDESVNNEESVETEEKLQPNLPEITFNGYEFRMLGKGTSVLHWQSKDLAADEYTGEPINDAVYERNNYVGSRFDVKFRNGCCQYPGNRIIMSGITIKDHRSFFHCHRIPFFRMRLPASSGQPCRCRIFPHFPVPADASVPYCGYRSSTARHRPEQPHTGARSGRRWTNWKGLRSWKTRRRYRRPGSRCR